MTNPPNQPRDDRRMHEGEKKGVGADVNEAKQEVVTPELGEREPEPAKGHTERAQPSPLEEEVTTRSNA